MARYSVLHHRVPEDSGRENHFDLLLENFGALATWEVLYWPPTTTETENQSARRLPDHRLEYLEFEGSLSNDRGQVKRVCEGTFQFVSQTTEHWIVSMSGKVFSGIVHLNKAKADQDTNTTADDQCWILSWEPATD